jgi:hypothetical protein
MAMATTSDRGANAATGTAMGYWLLPNNEVEDLEANAWQWGATMQLIVRSNFLEQGVEIFGDRMVFARPESCVKLADWLEENVVCDLQPDSRVTMSGEVVLEPDDGTFHRDDLADNYSVDRKWLFRFISFLRGCGGFNTLG